MLYFNTMRRNRFAAFISLIVLLLVVNCSLAWAAKPNQLVVKLKPRGIGAASVRSLAARFGTGEFKLLYEEALKIRPDWTHLADDYIVILPATVDAQAAAREFRKTTQEVVSAAPDSVVRAFAITPNDPSYPQQWGLTKIQADRAWEKTRGTTEVIVAVLDTGLNYNHEDFAGRVNTAYMKDLVNGDDDPLDDYGHGTAVSGVIAAVSNNGKGIAGLDWNCQILPLKVLDSSGSGLVSTISSGLAYLAALKSTGVNIVAANMSLGQYNTGTDHYTEENPASLRSRCQDCYDQGIVLVAAAGNGGVNWNTYPAFYSTVIAVAATDSSDKRSVWSGLDPETGQTQSSNFGRKNVPGFSDNLWVDVAAPGSGIYSTDKNGSYSSGWNGTSLASPYVAGLATLIKGENPTMTVAQIMTQISTTADNLDALNPSYVGMLGSGRINCYKALAGVISELSSPADGAYIKGATDISGTASGWNFRNFQLEALQGATVETMIATSFVSIESGRLGIWDTAGLNGNYTIRLRVLTNDLASADAAVAVIVDNTSPEVAISSPASSATVSSAVTVSGQASDAYLDYYTLEYGAGLSPTTYQTIGKYYSSVTGGVLGTWETSGLSGVYTIRLTAIDRGGSGTSVSQSVQIDPTAPKKELDPQTGLPLTFALPNPFSRSTTTETAFVYDLAGNFNTTIYLFDLNGSLIWSRSFAAGDNGGKSGKNDPAWDGRSLYSEQVPNGVYFYQISADRKIIGRGKIIVLN
ncbi:MAG: S8 family peptidase [Candidatus Margulisbacteria bacterium]|jgi:subtilisin family serine protease|nr:S8 family peptidase [Candidatus Margulisiibacteriota bacterium]